MKCLRWINDTHGHLKKKKEKKNFTFSLFWSKSNTLSSVGNLAKAIPLWSDEWWVVCKFFHIGSDLLISECWHLDPLSSVLLQQNDYFFIISLIFHHYCTSSSFHPNYYSQLPFWEAIMLWTSIISLLWNCPCARSPLDVIFLPEMAVPLFHLQLYPCPVVVIKLSFFTYWPWSDTLLVCAALSMSAHVFFTIATFTQ